MQTFLRLALLSLVLVFASCLTENDVKNVRQNYEDKLNSGVVQQIHDFSKSVLFYKAYASYFDRADVDLPGFKNFFRSLSEERLTTANNLTEVVNQRGGYVTFQNVKLRQLCLMLSRKLARFPHVCFYVMNQSKKQKPASKYRHQKRKPSKTSYRAKMMGLPKHKTTPEMPNALSALQDALSLETVTNQNLIALMGVTVSTMDPAMRLKLDPFLESQVDLIFRLSNLVTRLDLYKNTDSYNLGEYILDSELTY